MDSSQSFNTNQNLIKSLNTTYILIISIAIILLIVAIYLIINYYDYIEYKKHICKENEILIKNLNNAKKNNELLFNKKNQLSEYISNNIEDCKGEWSECDNNCKKTFKIIQPKSNNGKDCEYKDGLVKDCIDSGDCSPVDCMGEWSNCKDNIKRYKINSPAKRGGKECEAEDGAINKTDCISKETSNNLLNNLLLGITNFFS
jgi:hypothetical protein